MKQRSLYSSSCCFPSELPPLGREIYLARWKKKWTIEELSRKTAVERQSLWKIERGEIKTPTRKTLCKIAAALGIDEEKLIFLANKEKLVSGVADGRVKCAQSFSTWLEQTRNDKELGAGEAAALSGLTKAQYMDIEGGKIKWLSYETLLGIANSLGLPVREVSAAWVSGILFERSEQDD